MNAIELWGGIECSLVRVGDEYHDQLRWSGHDKRLDDLDRFYELGLRTLRMPLLWERTAPQSPDALHWEWSDARFCKLWQLGIRPIVGLTHHGSGPSYASFEQPHFPEAFARYAGAVAGRYPWVADYTPINEPLTTARFAGLYGLWHPHQREGLAFARILLNQLKATVLAMRAIRLVRPDARLVQTEDLGQTHARPLLQYQADFENERRWLTWDLLLGRVTPGHPMFDYLRWVGIPESAILFFAENPCPPDLLGVNHYITSERFLDERLDRYPPHLYGSNHRHAYVDTEAVRAANDRRVGIGDLLGQVWERYGRPLAITEVHLGCTREEQLRWFDDVWQAAQHQFARGTDIRAVTAWALLGSYNWDSLLTQNRGHYEPGLFDVRAPRPRPTALARLVSHLATGQSVKEPVLPGKGWWQSKPKNESRAPPPLLITGATGTLGKALAWLATQRGLNYHILSRQELDIADPQAVREALRAYRPWAVINAAGYVRVAQAAREPERCFRENRLGAVTLARACRDADLRLLTFSSDLVFDGKKNRPYLESDPTSPGGVYGASKAAAERDVLTVLPTALVVRTSAFFGPWDGYNFATVALRTLGQEAPFEAANHVRVSPTYLPDLVQNSLDLLLDGAEGCWHLANPGEVSWAEFARMLALRAGLDATCVETWYEAQCAASAGHLVLSTALGSEKASVMPSLENAVERYLREKKQPHNVVLL